MKDDAVMNRENRPETDQAQKQPADEQRVASDLRNAELSFSPPVAGTHTAMLTPALG